MRFRRDTRGEIGVFEDLQTLLVVVVGVGILLGSTLYNWSAISSTEEDQDLYDEAEHIVKQIESYQHLRAHNNYGTTYTDFMLKQSELTRLWRDKDFDDVVRSDLRFNISFDDMVIGPDNEVIDNESKIWKYDHYTFGDTIPKDKETTVLTLQYTLVMDIKLGDQKYDVSQRHPCLVTVVVWR
ncbi:MAG: hypothetical protein KAQ96_05280 [Thermoplasmata archaeon]|nr:hypothetical protein [Thermoplasmata archaeon]MCK5413842.1 hypothetical protein [Thermoplasmata archaeon]